MERENSGEGLRRMIGAIQTEDEVKMSEALGKVAAGHGIESITAVALAYAMCKAPNVFPIVGGHKVEHLIDNIQELKMKLKDAQIEYLESIRPLDVGFPNSFVGEDPHVSGKLNVFMAAATPLALVQARKAIGHE